jgi:hypothetical protein
MSSSLGSRASSVDELQRFADQLSIFDEITVDELCRKLALDPSSIPEPTNKSRQSARVAGYADRLQQGSGDRLQFLSLMSKLRADKEMRVGEMNDLVTSLTKVPTKLKNKKAGLEAIEAWSQRKLDTQRRLGSTEDLF